MKPILNEDQYLIYLKRLEEIFQVEPDNSPSGNPLTAELNEIAALVREYEEAHYPIKSDLWVELNVFLFDVKVKIRRLCKKVWS